MVYMGRYEYAFSIKLNLPEHAFEDNLYLHRHPYSVWRTDDILFTYAELYLTYLEKNLNIKQKWQRECEKKKTLKQKETD